MTPSFDEAVREFNALGEQAGRALKEQLIELLRDSAQESGVVALRWVQYAPYFNDGDPCQFDRQEETELLYEESDYWDESSCELHDKADALLGSVHPEVLWRLFGNNVQVTLRGEVFTTEPYTDHD